MVQDLHAHTYYSFCGLDKPETVIETMVAQGIELMGITDHHYGIGMQRQELDENDGVRMTDYQRGIFAYHDHMRLLQAKYRDQIEMKCGIEIATLNIGNLPLPAVVDISQFDYCLIEHIDLEETMVKDLFAFAARCGCETVGLAHTDLPSFLDKNGVDKLAYFSEMAKRNIFWEMNVSYDSIHGYHEHAYVKRFFEDEALQELVRKSGVSLSVGFDGHRINEYPEHAPKRVKECCEKITALNIPLVFEKR